MSSFQHQNTLKNSWGFGQDLRTSYKWDWSVLLKNKELRREEYITGMLEVNVTEGHLMEGYASREPFYFSMAVPISIIRTVNNWVMTDLQRISTTSFITVDIFALVVPYLFSVWFFLL